jgi:hypothetical protein
VGVEETTSFEYIFLWKPKTAHFEHGTRQSVPFISGQKKLNKGERKNRNKKGQHENHIFLFPIIGG